MIRVVTTVSVSPSFGAKWLVPRLDRFTAAHPDIEIRIDGTDRLVDLTRDDVDVSVRYGPGGYQGARVDCIFKSVDMPVCSPALLDGAHPLRAPSDLRHHTLLHVEWKTAEEFAPSWRMWLLAAGLKGIDPTRGPRFSMETMAVQAATDGQGVEGSWGVDGQSVERDGPGSAGSSAQCSVTTKSLDNLCVSD